MTDGVLAKVDHTIGTPCLQTHAVVISTKSTMMSLATADPSPNPHALQKELPRRKGCVEVVQPSPSVSRKYHSEEMAAMTSVLPVRKDAGV